MIKCLLALVALVAVCQAVSITTGPTGTTVEVGQRFTLNCAVANKQDSESVFWKLFPHNTQSTVLLTLDKVSKNPSRYELQANTYNLIVKNASYEDDGVFECEAGTQKRDARVYVWDKPDNMTLEWEHSKNGPNSVKANQQYKLKCTSKNSHPPAQHRYFKDGSALSLTGLTYTFNNYTDRTKGYGDTVSVLPFTPTQDDVNGMKTIRCVADLWTKQNASSAAFRINSAPKSMSLGIGAVLMVFVGLLLQ